VHLQARGLKETEILQFNYASLKQSSSFEKIQQIERQIIQNEYIEKEHREYTFLTMSAYDRYFDFLRNHKDYLQHLLDKDISSFLGLGPASLSRKKRNDFEDSLALNVRSKTPSKA
jgi:predicted KAP-like P-loop ATPase